MGSLCESHNSDSQHYNSEDWEILKNIYTGAA